ncbi:MAG: caspase family protein [Bacteroidia bacterium]
MQNRRNNTRKRDFLYDLMLAQLSEGEIDEAQKTLKAYLIESEVQDLPIPKVLADFPKWSERRNKSPRFALLVGVNGPNSQYTHQDLSAWQQCLTEQMGFATSNITVLQDEQASREQILIAFKKLVAQSRRFPAFFIYAGTGSVRSGEPAKYGIMAHDSLNEEEDSCHEIPLKTLADASTKAKTLSVILDAGWVLDYDRAYGIAGYYEKDEHNNVPLIGNSMMVSSWESKERHLKRLICKENEKGSLFSQALIAQIQQKSGASFSDYHEMIAQAPPTFNESVSTTY